jgi:LPXTG-motif cell wall-anchored protein
MKSFRNLLAALAAVLAITCLAQGAPAFADNVDNRNEVAYWQTQVGDSARCVKHEPGDSTPDGQLTDGGTSVTLNPGNWVLLVVKSGSAGADGDGNAVYPDPIAGNPSPVAGTAYFGPLNGGEQQGTVSHWIVCSGAPTPEVTTVTTDNGTPACGATTIGETLTTTTTPYILVNGEWRLDPTNAHVDTTQQTRDLAPSERFDCPPPPTHDPEVTTVTTDNGTPQCGATTIGQTVTTTTTPYILVNGEWQLDPTNAHVETAQQTRDLTPAEQFPCDVVVPTQSPAFVEATCTADAELVLPETPGVTYTPSGPATAGTTVTVAATATQGYVLSGQSQWTHTFTSPDASQCSQSEPPTPTDSQTGSEAIVDTPTQTDQSASESPAPGPAPAPATQLPKTGNDHVTLLALIAAVLLGGGVTLSAAAARRRT